MILEKFQIKLRNKKISGSAMHYSFYKDFRVSKRGVTYDISEFLFSWVRSKV